MKKENSGFLRSLCVLKHGQCIVNLQNLAPTESHFNRAIYEHLNVNISISSYKMHQNARNSDNN